MLNLTEEIENSNNTTLPNSGYANEGPPLEQEVEEFARFLNENHHPRNTLRDIKKFFKMLNGKDFASAQRLWKNNTQLIKFFNWELKFRLYKEEDVRSFLTYGFRYRLDHIIEDLFISEKYIVGTDAEKICIIYRILWSRNRLAIEILVHKQMGNQSILCWFINARAEKVMAIKTILSCHCALAIQHLAQLMILQEDTEPQLALHWFVSAHTNKITPIKSILASGSPAAIQCMASMTIQDENNIFQFAINWYVNVHPNTKLAIESILASRCLLAIEHLNNIFILDASKEIQPALRWYLSSARDCEDEKTKRISKVIEFKSQEFIYAVLKALYEDYPNFFNVTLKGKIKIKYLRDLLSDFESGSQYVSALESDAEFVRAPADTVQSKNMPTPATQESGFSQWQELEALVSDELSHNTHVKVIHDDISIHPDPALFDESLVLSANFFTNSLQTLLTISIKPDFHEFEKAEVSLVPTRSQNNYYQDRYNKNFFFQPLHETISCNNQVTINPDAPSIDFN
ncbi:MAG: hypothetical protein H0U71_04545 [Gammaproteobacteria bacterium]|nr:hypothetical protein [Gammaproteobacteria bacterium]